MKKIIALIFIVMMFISACGEEEIPTIGDVKTEDIPAKTQDDKITIKNVFSSKSEMKCTIKGKANDVPVDSVIYTKGDKVRVDSVTQEGTYIAVFDKNTLHSWVKGSKEGIKIDLDKLNEEQGGDFGTIKSKDAVAEEFDNSEDVTYDCNKEKIDASLFAIPADVTFQDFAELLEQMKNIAVQ